MVEALISGVSSNACVLRLIFTNKRVSDFSSRYTGIIGVQEYKEQQKMKTIKLKALVGLSKRRNCRTVILDNNVRMVNS